MKPGLFISIEGCEGAGKSTAVRFIKQYLQKLAVAFLVTREPGGTPIAEAIRQVLLAHHEEPMAAKAEALLMFASRAQHVTQTIIPALAKGTWVVSDRFMDASYAYQGGGRELGISAIDTLAEWTLGDFVPDMTILLDVPVAIGAERVRRRNHLDRIEVEEQAFFERIRTTYLQLAERDSTRYRVIDSSASLDSVKEQLTLILSQAFEKWQGRES